MLKLEMKSSELMQSISETLTIIPGGIASLNSKLRSLDSENHEGVYEVPDGTKASH
jgi:hypothetical protein